MGVGLCKFDSMRVFAVGWACYSHLDAGLFLYVPDMPQRLGCEPKSGGAAFKNVF